MSDDQGKPTFKTPLPIGTLDVNTSSSLVSPNLDSASPAGDASRKKSGFLITRIDKASISSVLENESDMENEYGNERAGAGCRSPGSSSVISDASSIFDDGVSPLEKTATITAATTTTIPTIALQGATPVVAPWPARPSGFLPPADLKPLATKLTGGQEQQTIISVGVLSPLNVQSPATNSAKDTTSSSRFHIIKIDTGPYKRGRWNCRDFDESVSNTLATVVRSDMIAVGGPRTGSSNGSSGRTSYHIVADENGRPHAPAPDGSNAPLLLLAAAVVGTPAAELQPKTPATNTDFPQSIRAVSPAPDVSTTSSIHQTPANANSNNLSSNNIQEPNSSLLLNASTLQQVPVSSTNKFQTQSGVDLNNAAAALLDSIIVGSIQKQNDPLLTASSTTTVENGDAALLVGNLDGVGTVAASVMVQNASPTSGGTSSVAIDNKIEQAMDLVKTHLLYAVREEVEVLKEKIIDLEKKVFRLETENKLLREYAPPDILQQIQHHSSATAVGQSVSSFLSSHISPSSSQPQSMSSPLTSPLLPSIQSLQSPTTPATRVSNVDVNSAAGSVPRAISPTQQSQFPS